MFIKNKINTVLLASLVFGLASCQDQKKEKISPEVIHSYTDPGKTIEPSVKDIVSEPQAPVEEYRKLTPVLDAEFEENMRRKTELLEQSNAKLESSSTTHYLENDDNINSNDDATKKSEKNTGLTELDAVEQAIQAAAPALYDNVDN